MITNKNKVLNKLEEACRMQRKGGNAEGVTTEFLASELDMQRTNISCILNELCAEGKAGKRRGKPVLYFRNAAVQTERMIVDSSSFDLLVGSEISLKGCIQKAKAAMLYPPGGLHTLLLGPTGVGKTMFAELMFKFAVENRIYEKDTPFVSFNCADYASNPQLLYSHLFGTKKGAYTGAVEERAGIVEKARNGILFLDEVHRLPPEGQEMLFYLIDKCCYRPLGGVEDIQGVNVLLICATTEDENSVLLSTFKRRIPMIISLPSLMERTPEERLSLVCEFFKIEAGRTGREIVLASEVVKRFVLYHCLGNVGQLKSDIQLSCANAFLRCITYETEKIQLELVDLPDEIKKGILHYKQFQSQIDHLIPQDTKFSFTAKCFEKQKDIGSDALPRDFYENIENRIQELKKRHVSEKDINLIMSLDIDNYFKTFIYKMNRNINKKEMSAIVDERVVDLVETFLSFAEKKLNKIFPQRIFFSLCLHVDSALSRIKKGKPIVNYMLHEIIEKYPDEYAASMHFSELMEREFGVKIPADEIGYISMFVSEDYFNEAECGSNPVVLIAMHGRTTASSMADVVNKLVGADNVYAYDMHLEKAAPEAYEELKHLMTRIDRGGGILLLVDMGSIGVLSEVISNEAKIKIRVIDMATTVLGIECSRKAMVERDIDTIWKQIEHSEDYWSRSGSHFRIMEPEKDNVILTVCLTGEGSALKLKNLIEENISFDEKNIQIVPIPISGKQEMKRKIDKLSKSKNILGIVGTVNPEIHGIPFLAAAEIILEKNYNWIRQLVCLTEGRLPDERKAQQKQLLGDVIASISNEIEIYDVKALEPALMDFLRAVDCNFDHKLSFDASIGLLMHLCFAIEKKRNGYEVPQFRYKDQIVKNFENELAMLKACIMPIEHQMNLAFSEDELSAILFFFDGVSIAENEPESSVLESV